MPHGRERRRRTAGPDPPRSGAPPPEPAILALQRGAGNQAVTRALLQRFTPSPATEEAHAKAKTQHTQDRAAVVNALTSARTSSDVRLRNTGQWIETGRSRVYALTPTADSQARATHKQQEGKKALFGYPSDNAFTTGE